eukprot:jgi/Ulvmu1/4365/UM002_0090.1
MPASAHTGMQALQPGAAVRRVHRYFITLQRLYTDNCMYAHVEEDTAVPAALQPVPPLLISGPAEVQSLYLMNGNSTAVPCSVLHAKSLHFLQFNKHNQQG